EHLRRQAARQRVDRQVRARLGERLGRRVDEQHEVERLRVLLGLLPPLVGRRDAALLRVDEALERRERGLERALLLGRRGDQQHLVEARRRDRRPCRVVEREAVGAGLAVGPGRVDQLRAREAALREVQLDRLAALLARTELERQDLLRAALERDLER